MTFRGTEGSTGIYQGTIDIVDSIDGDLIFQGLGTDIDNPGANDITVTSDISLGGGLEGDLIFGAAGGVDAVNYDGNFSATSTGNILVYGDFSGEFSTDALLTNGFFTEGEGALGNITVTGNYSGSAIGILGIGHVLVNGNLTTTNATGATAFYTSSGGTGDSFLANIGTVTIEGDVDQADNADKLIDINVNGNFGAIDIKGAGTLGSSDGGDFLTIGDIDTGGSLGGDEITGTITITDDASDIELLGININSGTLGAVSITGPGTGDSDLRLDGIIGGNNVTVNDITVTGFRGIEQNAEIDGSSVNNVSYTTITPNATDATLIELNAFIDSGSDIGNIVLNAGTTNSKVDINAALVDANNGNGDISNITITGADIDLDNAGGDITNANTIAAIDITGDKIAINADFVADTFTSITFNGPVTFWDGVGIKPGTNLASLNITGLTTFDTTSGDPNILVSDSGTLTFGSVDFTTGGGGPAIVADDGTSDPDVIGGIVINGLVAGKAGVVDIQASAFGDITISGQVLQGERLVTDLQIAAVNIGDTSASDAETVSINGSNLSDYTIGNVTIEMTNTFGIPDNFLFDGTTFIQALGGMGNITLITGGSPAVQAGLFDTATPSEAIFVVGHGNLGVIDKAGVDFDGDGTIGTTTHNDNIVAADETAANFSGGSVSIGDITIIGPAVSGTNLDTILDGTNLLILSGVEAGVDAVGVASDAFDGDSDTAAPADPATSVQEIDPNLNGSIGDVLATTLSLLLADNPAVPGGTAVEFDTITTSGGIFATDTIGNVQALDQGAALDDPGEGIIIGDDNTETIGKVGNDEILVFLV